MSAKQLAVHATIDAGRSLASLRAAQRRVREGTRKGLFTAATRHALPKAKRESPSRRVRFRLTVGANQRSAYLQMRVDKSAPHGPLLEFGGQIPNIEHRGRITFPRKAKALRMPWGYRASLKTPRRYEGRHFMQRAVTETAEQVVATAGDVMVGEFERVGLDVGAH